MQQNKDICEFAARKDLRGLLDFAVENRERFDHVNWATTFSKLGRVDRDADRIKRDPRFSTLLRELEEKISEGFDVRAGKIE